MLIGAVSSIWNLFFIWQRWYRDVPARCIGTGCDFAPVAGTETTKKQIPDTTYTLIPHPVLADYTDAIQKDKL